MGKYADIKDRIKQLRKSNGMSQQQLADKLNITNVAVSQWERGVKQPKTEMREALCDLFNVNLEYLNGNWDHVTRLISDDEMRMLDEYRSNAIPSNALPLGHYRIPVVATVAAGEPIFSEESILEWIDYDKDPRGEVFGLRIKGDSMIPRISDGDTIVVDKSAVWEDGDIVVVTVNGNDGTCKRIKKYKDGISLISLNPSYEPMFFTKSQVEELPVRVVGRVMESRSKF
ncbi:MAG: XRE family transcriptional regulator [Lachnospiraceae bacterium]|nr:XRE family transcriptional regulator [Lachnospiraceae bacterium]